MEYLSTESEITTDISILPPQDTLGDRLSLLRRLHGLTQESLANKLGTNHPTISNYEHNTHTPNYERLLQILNLTSVSSDWLLGNTIFHLTSHKIEEHSDLVQQATIRSMIKQSGEYTQWYSDLDNHNKSLALIKENGLFKRFTDKEAPTSLLLSILRTSHGLSRNEVCQHVQGLTLTTLADLEAGRRLPGAKFIGKLSKFFAISCDYLLRLDTNSTFNPDLYILKSQGYLT